MPRMNLADPLLFIENLASFNSTEDVGTAYSDFIKSYGFLAAACGESRELPEGRSWQFFFNTWPVEWLQQYQKNDYVRHDLVPMTARITSLGFTWREALSGRNLTQKQNEHYEWALGLGIVDVFAMPFHHPGGDFGLCVSISDHAIKEPQERSALQIVSHFVHQRCLELGGLTEASSVKAPLTAREVECLRWVLKGKSDTDIGAILDISHTTVHFHVERVKKKLGVKTRTQAAAMCAVLGYV